MALPHARPAHRAPRGAGVRIDARDGHRGLRTDPCARERAPGKGALSALAEAAADGRWTRRYTEAPASARARVRAAWERWARRESAPALEWALEHPEPEAGAGCAVATFQAAWRERMAWGFDSAVLSETPGWSGPGGLDGLWEHLETLETLTGEAIEARLRQQAPLDALERAWRELGELAPWAGGEARARAPAGARKLARLAQIGPREWGRLYAEWSWLRRRIVQDDETALPRARLWGRPLERWVVALAREEAERVGLVRARTRIEAIVDAARQWPFGDCAPALATIWALAVTGAEALTEREWAGAMRVEGRTRGASAAEHLEAVRALARRIETEIEEALKAKAYAAAQAWAPGRDPRETLRALARAVRRGGGAAVETAHEQSERATVNRYTRAVTWTVRGDLTSALAGNGRVRGVERWVRDGYRGPHYAHARIDARTFEVQAESAHDAGSPEEARRRARVGREIETWRRARR